MLTLIDAVRQDLGFGIRMVVKNPAFALVTMFILALGIGANSAIFTVLDAVLLKPLPYPQPDRLAMVWLDNRRQGIKEDWTNYPTYQDWKKGSPAFQDMALISNWSGALTGVDEPEQLEGVRVTANFFSVMGVAPQFGNAFSTDQEEPGRDGVVILSDGFWKRKFGGSRNVIGQKMQVNGRALEVIGVMPAGFLFPSKKGECWLPLAQTAQQRASRGGFFAYVVGRLHTGATIEQAQSDLDAAAKRIEEQFPGMRGYGANAVPLARQTAGNARIAVLVLAGAVLFVLLIACTNVAGLFLAKAEARAREIAVRAALGASRARLIGQLLTEGMVIAVGAGAMGLALAVWSIGALIRLAPADLPRLDEIRMESGMLWFTLAITMVTAVMFGLAPALRGSRVTLTDSLREGGRSGGGGVHGRKMREALVIAEFAMALVLLTGAGLMIRTLAYLKSVDPGFRPEHVLSFAMIAPNTKFPERAQVVDFYARLIEHVRTLPGVRDAGAIRDMFLTQTPNSGSITVEDHAPEPEEHQVESTLDPVTPRYFATMGVRLERGRFFTDSDGPISMPVAIINQTMAKRYWGNEDPVRKRFKFGAANSQNPWMTVVGEIVDMRRQGLDSLARCETFEPLAQMPSRFLNLVVRTDGDPLALAQAVRAEVRAIDRDAPIVSMATIEQQLSESIGGRRFQTLLLGLFSGLALVLAAIGIYGLMYQSIARRTHEIGVRVALGASRRDVVNLVLGEGLGLAVIGIAIRLAGSLALTRAIASLLSGVTATDPVTFGSAAGVLLLVATVASLIPAWRSTRVDPMVALRYE